MAQIVGTNVDLSSELVALKKNMWNHRPFGDVYRYNDPILAVKELSRMPVTALIEKMQKDWAEVPDEMLLSGQVSFPGVANAGVNSMKYPATNYILGKVEEDDTESPRVVYASMLEIADPFTWSVPKGLYERLQVYMEMGLYPTVGVPRQFDELSQIFIKYDECCPVNYCGTIIDLRFIKEQMRLFATVMWDPHYTKEYRDSVYGTGCGVLMCRNAHVTPELWKDACKDVQNFGSNPDPTFFIPHFELSPHTVECNRLIFNPTMTELVNELVITGRMELDYINFMTQRIKDTTDTLVKVAQYAGVQLDPEMKPIFPDEGSAPKPEPKMKGKFISSGPVIGENKKTYAEPVHMSEGDIVEPAVPVEDAADDWTAFIRGLDEKPVEGRPADVYSGMVEESLGQNVDIG